MRGLTDRLKKGRVALAVLGLVTALGGSLAVMPAAQARDHDYDRRDWRHERWERERWARIQEERARERWRWEHRFDRPAYYYGPSYYAPPPAYSYGQPSVGFGFTIRN